ncbi:hypothetical protein QL104_10265 [Pseudomonas piscis]|uniref:DUF3137 domain-containing protein n=1 Tax=Pseudomonas piscis TaxID=2614538 RepID=A0ABY9NQ21_9PSED|nr:hypothetical protein [Pseudomonas piscis]WMN19772.1 hypothetical protein QL104_10265 [Pseudomonas piscis]
MQLLKHDAELVRLLGDCDSAVARARSNADLLVIIDRLKSFKGGLRFDHAQSWVLLLLAIMAAIPALAGVLLMWFATACLGFASLYIWMSRKAAVDELPKKIARKCSLLSNGLQDPGGSADERFNQLSEEFADYDRGNDSRRIEASAKGLYQGPRHQLSFVFHHLRYVNSHIKNQPNNESERVYESFDRYSLVIDFPWIKDVVVLSNALDQKKARRGAFETTFADFNRAFILNGESELVCAKFAKPATQVFLLGLHRRLKNVNLEFSSRGRLCLSFDDTEVMAYDDPGTFEDLQGFYDNIERGLALPNLFPVLALVHELAELQDDNFDRPLKVTEEMEQ